MWVYDNEILAVIKRPDLLLNNMNFTNVCKGQTEASRVDLDVPVLVGVLSDLFEQILRVFMNL